MRLTVTGGAGFIGHHAVRELLARGHEVTVLDDLSRGSFERPDLEGARLLVGDIRSAVDCARAVDGADAVLHLAAISNVMGSQGAPEICFDVNVTGSWNVLRATAEAGVRHLVFTSSREIYGDAQSLPVTEDTPPAPKNAYGHSKLAGEAVLGMLAESPAVSVLRLSNVVGAGDSGRVAPLWLDAARAGEPLVIFGGRQLIDFVPVETVVACLVRLVEGGPLPAEHAGPINVGSGRSTSLPELAERVLDAVAAEANGAAPVRSEVRVEPPRGPEVERFLADTTRMRTLLGVDPPQDTLSALATYGGVG